MMKISLLLYLALPLFGGKSPQFRQTERQKLEREILGGWAEDYVDAFFQPSLPVTVKFSLDQFYVQRDERKTEGSLYRAATKYNFYNDPLLSASKLTDVFKTEASLVEKSGGKEEVSQELQGYLLGRLFSAPRLSDSEHSKTVSTYLTIKLGRLGLYTVNQRFQFVNVYDGMTQESGCRSHLLTSFYCNLLSGLNIFGLMPGQRWGRKEDKISKYLALTLLSSLFPPDFTPHT